MTTTPRMINAIPDFSHLSDPRDVLAHLSGWFGAMADTNCTLSPDASRMLGDDIWKLVEKSRDEYVKAAIAKILEGGRTNG